MANVTITQEEYDRLTGKKSDATKPRTQVCFLLDETQSMYARKQETIKGFNGYLEDLKKDQGDEVLFTLTTFNASGIKTPYKASEIKDVKPLDDKSYNPRDYTPLYDAIGRTIHSLEASVGKEDLVIFTILTDGEENSSHEYTLSAVKELIKKNEEKQWKFIFLGVGIDAFAGGSQFGFSRNQTFDINPAKTDVLYDSMSSGHTAMRGAYAKGGISATLGMSVVKEEDRKKLSD